MNQRFLHIIKSRKPVLVDFYADWCGPCKEIPPVLKKVKQELKDVRIVKVNVDRNPFIASRYKVNRLPTLIVFKEGEPIWTHEGIFCPEKLKSILQSKM
ncbi:thioredoxin [Tangfeifania diversioriginum]|uniref:Thioredoxin n=1 Tax=Tangfeifania diversioriginum TaxID=1168035 RepID=A0A1M6E8E3_9BACT|nr:thioredoxin [Tangfeifania diversioriginum]SHI81767.1 thioredoxin [Tangfeifania diversioriginum]